VSTRQRFWLGFPPSPTNYHRSSDLDGELRVSGLADRDRDLVLFVATVPRTRRHWPAGLISAGRTIAKPDARLYSDGDDALVPRVFRVVTADLRYNRVPALLRCCPARTDRARNANRTNSQGNPHRLRELEAEREAGNGRVIPVVLR
jgi:hypothetical protein